ncbi:translocon-associated protein subunit beta-like [Ruditapes philippinarum]|uniref:translocon-associated protein subunit beta-like n=1 Tax=Ruditapes philippinarum TaxID=129788 RepID=UPI00295A87F7|nr:translocon-associated protein subunit beta-like [Ruditapes philippinarum]
MKILSMFVILLLASFQGYLADDEGEARLLASKNILNQYLVEDKDLTVEYRIYNVGGSAAQKVRLSDDSFPEADFAVVAGNLEAYWERIAPNTNVTHSVILKPLNFGYFNFTAAEVSYSSNDDFDKRQVGYTSAPGEGGIVSFKDFNRRFSPHVLDWMVFAVMTLPSLGIPFLLWFSSKSKYDSSKPKKS